MLVWCLTVMGLAYIYQVRVAYMAYIRLVSYICQLNPVLTPGKLPSATKAAWLPP